MSNEGNSIPQNVSEEIWFEILNQEFKHGVNTYKLYSDVSVNSIHFIFRKFIFFFKRKSIYMNGIF